MADWGVYGGYRVRPVAAGALMVGMVVAVAPWAGAQNAGQMSAQPGTAPQMPAHARGDIAGDWQGTAAGEREVLRITKLDDGGWQTLVYQIDQDGMPRVVPLTMLQGDVLKFDFGFQGQSHIHFEGRVSADGNAISGTWKEGDGPAAQVVFVRATKETAWAIPAPPKGPKMMAADADPSFAVATIKPTDPSAPAQRAMGAGMSFRSTERTFRETGATVAQLVAWAYDVHGKQVEGGPEWVTKDRYDISGEHDGEGWATTDQWRVMMRKLLAERFGLVVRHETKEMPVYVLTVATPGMVKAAQQGEIGMMIEKHMPGKITITAIDMQMADFARRTIGGILADRPMLDKTGLTGRYDISLTYAPATDAQGGGAAKGDDVPAPDVMSALKEQLGLKVEAVKAPVDVVVMEQVTRPTEN